MSKLHLHFSVVLLAVLVVVSVQGKAGEGNAKAIYKVAVHKEF